MRRNTEMHTHKARKHSFFVLYTQAQYKLRFKNRQSHGVNVSHSGASKPKQPPPPGLKPQCASRAPATHCTRCYRENTYPTLLFTSAESPKAGPLLKCCVIFLKYINIYIFIGVELSSEEMRQLGKSEEQLSCSSR